jgi:hypothetical protein
MRKLVLLAALLAPGCYLPRVVDDRAVWPDDVVRWTRAGVPEDVILERLRVDGMAVRLTADERLALKLSGVSERVIAAMEAAPLRRRVVAHDWWEPVRIDVGWVWWWGWPRWHFHWRHRH